MSTTTVESPASLRLPKPAEAAPHLPTPLQRTFNRGFFDRSDPLEAAGTQLEDFEISHIYALPREKHLEVIAALYNSVYARIRAESIPSADVKVVDYKDAAAGNESSRRFVVVAAETRRRTHMAVFASFRGYGDYLYVSVNSFMLPPMDVPRFLLAVLIAMGLVFVVGTATFGIGVFFLVIPWLLWQYRDVLRSLGAGDSLGMALRRRFQKWNDLGTFNAADVVAYFKCTVSLLLEGVEEVFRVHGISVAGIEQAQQHVHFTTKVINSGEGILNVMGSVVGGARNRVKSAAGR